MSGPPSRKSMIRSLIAAWWDQSQWVRWYSYPGINSFEFEAEAPSPEKIPASDLLGVTVILLTASYKDAEFIRVGYYVNNAYESEEMRENPPEEVQLDKVCREVLASKPRVTRFNINWYVQGC